MSGNVHTFYIFCCFWCVCIYGVLCGAYAGREAVVCCVRHMELRQPRVGGNQCIQTRRVRKKPTKWTSSTSSNSQQQHKSVSVSTMAFDGFDNGSVDTRRFREKLLCYVGLHGIRTLSVCRWSLAIAGNVQKQQSQHGNVWMKILNLFTGLHVIKLMFERLNEDVLSSAYFSTDTCTHGSGVWISHN